MHFTIDELLTLDDKLTQARFARRLAALKHQSSEAQRQLTERARNEQRLAEYRRRRAQRLERAHAGR